MDSSRSPSAPRLTCRPLPAERLLLTGVHLFDPECGLEEEGDLLVEDGRITALGKGVKKPTGIEVLDGYRGCYVFPGFVDPHCHLRTPGLEYKEDLSSGSSAAAAGGYVTIVAMANTEPVVDAGPLAVWVLDEAMREAVVRVGQVGAISKGLKGEELSEMRELYEAGVSAYSDDGRPVADAGLLLDALRYTRGTGRPLFLHLEDLSLSVDGVMHEGKWSGRLGLRGIPTVAETGPLARDIETIRYAHYEGMRIAASQGTGADSDTTAVSTVPLVHFQHLSAVGSVRLVRQAKGEGLPITAEVTPAHLIFTDERLSVLNQNMKINPPLRSAEDREALVAALADGTVDCIGTDHAPHAPQEKEVPMEDAVFGTTGFETAFAALHTGLVLSGEIPLARLIVAMSQAPSRILGVESPRLEVGAPADFCVVDLNETWTVTPSDLKSKSRNCAFLGETLTGRVCMTVVDGARRYVRAQ